MIPANADMTIGGGAFALSSHAGVDRHIPIDLFFRAPTQAIQRAAAAVSR